MNGSGFGSFLILLLPLLLLGYLVMSNRRRVREQQQIQASLVVGEDVVTNSGIFGRLIGLDDSVAVVEIASGVQVRFDRRAITRPPNSATSPASEQVPPVAGDE